MCLERARLDKETALEAQLLRLEKQRQKFEGVREAEEEKRRAALLAQAEMDLSSAVESAALLHSAQQNFQKESAAAEKLMALQQAAVLAEQQREAALQEVEDTWGAAHRQRVMRHAQSFLLRASHARQSWAWSCWLLHCQQQRKVQRVQQRLLRRWRLLGVSFCFQRWREGAAGRARHAYVHQSGQDERTAHTSTTMMKKSRHRCEWKNLL